MTLALFMSNKVQRWVAVSLLLLIIGVMAIPLVSSAFGGTGGFLSELLIGDGTNETLYLGDGTNENQLLGTCPVVVTGTGTSTSSGGVLTTTLRGTLTDLNGMPSASVWFSWGYTASADSFTTTPSTVTVTGLTTDTIDAAVGEKVYFTFHGSTDGEAQGLVNSFIAGGGQGVSYWLMHIILPIVIAGTILVFALIATSNPLYAFGGAVIGLCAYYVIYILIQVF